MIIATRMLRLQTSDGVVDVPITMEQPVEEDGAWFCTFTIGWPGKPYTIKGGGVDGVQALISALGMIGINLYVSEPHKNGQLFFEGPGQGYGFPVTKTVRDILVGHDVDAFGD